MKRLMLAIAATAAFVSVASAEEAWFTGTIGGSESGGQWTMTPGYGKITTNNTTLVIEDAAASFVATSKKSLSGSENLKFATSAKFASSYDELPEIDPGAKAGIVVYTNEYYVLAKDDTTWAEVQAVVANVREATEKLKGKDGLIGRLLSDKELSDNAAKVVENLAAVSGRLEKGEGTLGKLTAERALYDEISALVKDVRQIVDNYRDTTPITTFGSLATGAL